MSGQLKGIFFVRKYAVIPVQLEIFILQYIGWCVLVIWTFIVNQLGCFCQFYYYYYYYCYYYSSIFSTTHATPLAHLI